MLAVGAIAFSLRLNSRFRGKCTPSVACGDSSPYGKATHYDLCVASLLQIVFAATPEGEPSFLLPPPGEVPRSGQGGALGGRSHLISFYGEAEMYRET